MSRTTPGSLDPAKGGAQTYTEIVFANLQDGWCREKIGGHILRNNEIYNCGQAGIVGCMGGAFSTITGNHIHHINIRGEFFRRGDGRHQAARRHRRGH